MEWKPILLFLLLIPVMVAGAKRHNYETGYPWCYSDDLDCFNEDLVNFPIPKADLDATQSDYYLNMREIRSGLASREPEYLAVLEEKSQSFCASLPQLSTGPGSCDYIFKYDEVLITLSASKTEEGERKSETINVLFKPGWGGHNASSMTYTAWDVERMNARGETVKCDLGEECFHAQRRTSMGSEDHVGVKYKNVVIECYTSNTASSAMSLASGTLSAVKSLGNRTGIVPEELGGQDIELITKPEIECPEFEQSTPDGTECECVPGFERNKEGDCEKIPELSCDNGVDDNGDGATDCEDVWCYFNDPICKCLQVGGGDTSRKAWDVVIIGNEYLIPELVAKYPYLSGLNASGLRQMFLGHAQEVVDVFESVEPLDKYISQGSIRIWAYQLPKDHQNDLSWARKYCSKGDSFVMLHRITSGRSKAALLSDRADIYYPSSSVWDYHVLHELGHLEFGFVDEYVDTYSDTVLQWFKGPFSRTRNCYGNVIVPDWFSDREGCLEYFSDYSSKSDVTCHQGCMGNEWWRSSQHSIMRGNYTSKQGYDVNSEGFNSVHRKMIAERMVDYS